MTSVLLDQTPHSSSTSKLNGIFRLNLVSNSAEQGVSPAERASQSHLLVRGLRKANIFVRLETADQRGLRIHGGMRGMARAIFSSGFTSICYCLGRCSWRFERLMTRGVSWRIEKSSPLFRE